MIALTNAGTADKAEVIAVGTEYKTEWVPAETLGATLTARGKDGWEFVQSVESDTDRNHLCVFKRAVKEKA